MRFINQVIRGFTIALLLIAVAIEAVLAQQPSAQDPNDDVVRINAELVQTAITVVDKNGKFVAGLDRGDFELTIDGKPRPIQFLERVTAGSQRESQLAERKQPDVSAPAPVAVNTNVRGRTVIFYIDDLHLSFSSLHRARQMIAKFVDNEIGRKDLVAIASATGQIGFLQQFTSNREVLRAALARVNTQPSEERTVSMGSTPMSEFTAMTIESKPDSRPNNVMAVYIDECLKQSGPSAGDRRTAMALRLNCERLVRSNARNVLTQRGFATERMYDSLESLMRSSARLTGRKIVFFISDGFLSQGGPLGDNLSNKLKQITDAAQRANVVVYSIDARGLISGTLDATNNVLPDANGRMATLDSIEILATQAASAAPCSGS
jgi:VWFA-related protein